MEQLNDEENWEVFQPYLAKKMENLMTIWDEIGLASNDVKMRKRAVRAHLNNLIDEMLQEEENTKRELYESIKNSKTEIDKICDELGLPSYQPDDHFTVLMMERDLRLKLDYLLKTKKQRIDKLNQLREQDQLLCDQLASIPHYIPSTSSTIPSEEQLYQLEKHIEMLKKDKERRLETFKTSKKKILSLIGQLEVTLANQFEEDVVMETDESFVLSSQNMNNLKNFLERLEKRYNENKKLSTKLEVEVRSLWQQLNVRNEEREQFIKNNSGIKQKTIFALQEEVNRLKLLKLQNAKMIIIQIRGQLKDVWDRCYVGQITRKQFQEYYSEIFNEEILEKHEEEMRKMRKYYEERRIIIDKINQRNDIFDKYVQFELKASNPQRLFDKGWSLLKEEKERKKILKEIPKLEGEIEDDIKKWEKEKGAELKVMDVCFNDYIKKAWEDWRNKKENDKFIRQQNKQKQIEEEMIYGSKPFITPTKKTPNHHPHPPRSGSKSKRHILSNQNPASAEKQPLIDLNINTKNQSEKTFLFSHTLIGSNELNKLNSIDQSLAPVVHYQEFENMMNEKMRSHTRSSFIPKEDQENNNNNN